MGNWETEAIARVLASGRITGNARLFSAAELRSIDTVEEFNSVATTVKAEEIKLAKQVIGTFDAPLDLAGYKDE